MRKEINGKTYFLASHPDPSRDDYSLAWVRDEDDTDYIALTPEEAMRHVPTEADRT